MSIDDLLADKTEHPTIVIPLGNDHKVSHTFCVIDDLIFDSTQKFALNSVRIPLIGFVVIVDAWILWCCKVP